MQLDGNALAWTVISWWCFHSIWFSKLFEVNICLQKWLLGCPVGPGSTYRIKCVSNVMTLKRVINRTFSCWFLKLVIANLDVVECYRSAHKVSGRVAYLVMENFSELENLCGVFSGLVRSDIWVRTVFVQWDWIGRIYGEFLDDSTTPLSALAEREIVKDMVPIDFLS